MERLPTPPPSDSEDNSNQEHVAPIIFSAQSYMQYQADKFLKRFDANCYIHLTKKMDSHDIAHGRLSLSDSQPSYPPSEEHLQSVLSTVPPKALVVSVETDVLFTPQQQLELARCLPDAKFVALDSPDGHDGFLLEFETLNRVIREHLQSRCPWIYESEIVVDAEPTEKCEVVSSIFGEAETVDF
jgi:homoserine O-acetyltransferase